jgi:hypothetical protein
MLPVAGSNTKTFPNTKTKNPYLRIQYNKKTGTIYFDIKRSQNLEVIGNSFAYCGFFVPPLCLVISVERSFTSSHGVSGP